MGQSNSAWGLPDWRDASAYGDVSSWSLDRWRWEFYRRREDLREYFDARAETTFHYWQKFVGQPGFPHAHLRPDQPGFCVIVDQDARKRFGYSRLPNPRIGEQSAYAIWPYESDSSVDYAVGSDGSIKDYRGTLGELLDALDIPLTDEHRERIGFALSSTLTHLDPMQVAVTFDLDRPLEPQLCTARNVLTAEYEIRGKRRQKRRHSTKWLSYLRTLDARVDNASWREIAEIDSTTAQTEQTGRDRWEAANALRFNF